MKKSKLLLLLIFCVIFLIVIPASAHQGRTDANGGHYDNETGEYHYHHGYEAHHHINGICPYNYDDQTNHTSGTSYSDVTPKPEFHIETPDPYSPVISSENKDTTNDDKQGIFDKHPWLIIFINPFSIWLYICIIIFLKQEFSKQKKKQVRRKKVIMKRYSKLDTNVPMTFYYFYIYVRLPLIIISSVVNWLLKGINDEFWFIVQLAEILTSLCVCIGLLQKKYWGYVINKVFLIAEIVFSFLCIIVVGCSGGDLAYTLGSFIPIIIANALIFIYFEKRQYLFRDIPNLSEFDIRQNTLVDGTFEELHQLTPPSGYNIDGDGLPYKQNKVYGWGKEFNTFITANGDCYHKSKCPLIKGKKKTLLHRYTAMKHYKPCQYCKPKNYIDDWYLKIISLKKQTEEPIHTSKEIFFSHTCSQCKKVFKVKYKISEGQTFIPTLSAICPQCKSKETITPSEQ